MRTDILMALAAVSIAGMSARRGRRQEPDPVARWEDDGGAVPHDPTEPPRWWSRQRRRAWLRQHSK